MSGILVVTAPNRRNLGMYSVDNAATTFFSRIAADVSYGTVLDRYYLKAPYGTLPVRDLPGYFNDYDMIVYWGDFTTSPWYGYQTYSYILSRRSLISRITGIEPRRSMAFKKWVKYFSPSRISKNCHSVGQNFQIDHSGPEIESFFRTSGFDAEIHYKAFASILSRDSASQSFLQKIRGGSEQQTCDLAFLGRPLEKRESRKVRRIGLLLERSKLSAAVSLTRLLHEKYTVIDLSQWLSADPRNISNSYERAIEKISSCDAVITDVYHLSINALSLGVPVLCLGVDDAIQVKAVSDYKKRVLFNDLGLSEAYFSLESADVSAERLFSMINKKVESLEDFYTVEFWVNLQCIVDSSRDRLVRTLGL